MRRSATDATHADFDQVVANAPPGAPLLFHWPFIQTLAHACGYENRSLCVEADGRRWFLPILRRRVLGFYPIDLSLALGHHGGIFPVPDDAQLLAAIYAGVARQLRADLVVQNFATDERHAQSGLRAIGRHTTHVLSTRDVSYEALFTGVFDAKLRNQIRKGEKSDLSVEQGNDALLVAEFYRLYLMSNERWGTRTPKYAPGFFEAFVGQDFVRIKVARHRGQAVAAVVILALRDQHLYFLGAMDKEYGRLCPNHLLISEAVRDAISAGAAMFNFGASGRLDSVRNFKESFGARAQGYASYHVGNPVVGSVLRQMMRRAG